VTPDVPQLLETTGLPVTLLAAFAAGLLLSLTPCVYPMIPVTVAAFGAHRVSRGRRLLLSLSYVVGIAATYSLLGTWAAATGRLFGAALADPRVTGAFAVLLAFLAAASFGWIPALERLLSRTPGWAARLGGGSPAGALAMGFVAGVVFAPCVGPFVVGVLAYVAGTGDLVLGASLLASVGLGMGEGSGSESLAREYQCAIPTCGRCRHDARGPPRRVCHYLAIGRPASRQPVMSPVRCRTAGKPAPASTAAAFAARPPRSQ